MKELFLEFTAKNGEEKREPVLHDKCIVGRHSESDICISDERLSRKHLQIDRFGDFFVAADAGSSFGTVINGAALTDPVALKDGDILDLGGLVIRAVFESDEPIRNETAEAASKASGQSGVSVASQPQNAGFSGSMLLWILVPVLGLVFIVFAGVVIFLVVSGPTTTVAKKQIDPVDSEFDDDSVNDKKRPSNKSSTGKSDSNTESPSVSNASTNSDVPSGPNTTPPVNLSETARIEQNGGAFLRRIAQNDPRAFLTTEQAKKLSAKVKQFSSSAAVSDNLNSARKNASQIKSLAESKNIKPQLLAVAAIAKLGSSRGDVLQTAQGMTEVIDKLATQLGNELADDSLLVIAAYGQGSAGDFMKLRNMLQDLANKSPESSRAIRTIWFLQKNGKITQAEFDNALNFLAIGTISQNPKDFGVNAEALSL